MLGGSAYVEGGWGKDIQADEMELDNKEGKPLASLEDDAIRPIYVGGTQFTRPNNARNVVVPRYRSSSGARFPF